MKNQQPKPTNKNIGDSLVPPIDGKRFKLIACEIIAREVCLLISQSSNVIDVEFLRKGLHDAGKDVMSMAIQKSVTAADTEGYDAILLGYARCNDGVVGIGANKTPMVIPRTHDCITFFFGSREDYEAYFSEHPGTFFRTSGWTERNGADDDSVMSQLGINNTYDQYVTKYGKENADFIVESLGSWEENYEHITYIDMGLAIDTQYIALAKKEASSLGLSFKEIKGDWRMLKKLIAGDWDKSDFLLIPPGRSIAPDDDGGILKLT